MTGRQAAITTVAGVVVLIVALLVTYALFVGSQGADEKAIGTAAFAGTIVSAGLAALACVVAATKTGATSPASVLQWAVAVPVLTYAVLAVPGLFTDNGPTLARTLLFIAGAAASAVITGIVAVRLGARRPQTD